MLRAWAKLLYMLVMILVIYYVLFLHTLTLYTMTSMDLAKPLINVEVIFIMP